MLYIILNFLLDYDCCHKQQQLPKLSKEMPLGGAKDIVMRLQGQHNRELP